MAITKKNDILCELEQVRQSNKRKILVPSEVVEWAAENPETALHAKFCWDDTKAAEEYRLWQARELIHIHVRFEPKIKKNVKIYVSLEKDRLNPGGGYRTLVSVMGNKRLREQLLEQAKREALLYAEKYAALEELLPLFRTIKKVFRDEKPAKKRKAV